MSRPTTNMLARRLAHDLVTCPQASGTDSRHGAACDSATAQVEGTLKRAQRLVVDRAEEIYGCKAWKGGKRFCPALHGNARDKDCKSCIAAICEFDGELTQA